MHKSGTPDETSSNATFRLAESRLPQSEGDLRAIFEHTAVGVYRTTADGQVLMANPALVRMLGYKSFEELRHRDLADESHYEPQYPRSAFLERIERDGEVRGLESAWRRKDGGVLHAIENARAVRDPSGKTLYYEGTVEDITACKVADEQLVIFKRFADESRQGLGMADLAGNIVYCNDTLCRILGENTPCGALGKNVLAYYRDKDRKRLHDEILPQVLAGQPWAGEIPLVSVDGEVTTTIQSVFLLYDSAGKPAHFANVITDITEQTRVRKALEQDEEKFRLMYERSPLGYQSLDADGRFLEVNPAWLEMLGYRREEIIGHWFGDFVTGPSVALFQERFPCFKATGRVHGAQVEMIGKDRRVVSIELDGRVEYHADGTVRRTHCIVRDITKQKQAERALRESRRTADDIVRTIPAGLFIYQFEPPDRLILVSGNPESERLTGIRAEEWKGREFNEIWPEARQTGITEKFLQVVKTGDAFETEDLRYADERLTGAFRIRAFPLPERRLAVAFENITGRKQAEEDRERARQFMQTVIDGFPESLLVVNRDFTIALANRTVHEMAGGQDPVAAGLRCHEVSHNNDLPCQDEGHPCPLRAVIETRSPVKVEHTHRDSAGQETSVEVIAAPILDEQGQVAQIIESCRDITGRKQAEAALRQERDRAQQYLDVAGVMFVVLDAHGKVVLINRKGCELLGYSSEELVGGDWFQTCLPENVRDRIRGAFDEIMAGRLEPYERVENVVLCKDGQQRLIGWHNTVLRDARSRIVGTLSSGEDITERKRAEDQLNRNREQLRSLVSQLTTTEERERKALAGILHDDLIQNLALCKMRLDQASARDTDDETNRLLRDITDRIRELIASMRSLTFELCSPVLYDIGLEAAVRDWLDHNVKGWHTVKFDYEDDGQARGLAEDVRVFLFRAVRELCSNVIKHAKAQHATVSIQTQDEMIRIDVKDDGIGTAASWKHAKGDESGGLGLFGIRERLDHFGATMDIASPPEGGTCITLMAPLSDRDRV
ncbi:MAG: PAS domain S-box protein [Phycisphaerales bacterium]|nr:MAG: PAS domain S-box protein [Phycisphaerales bacterium]